MGTERRRIRLTPLALIVVASAVVGVARASNTLMQQQQQKSSSPSNQLEPMVAISCGGRGEYVVQYTTSGSSTQQPRWSPDVTKKSTCTTDKLEILKMCQRLYPSKDVTNIVESTKNVKLEKLCKLNKRGVVKCERSSDAVVTTSFFRCLESPFQSDALLVPSPCIFDHIHNASNCFDSRSWNRTAFKSCDERDMNLKSYAVLLPCGVGLFTGVEFVCCPKKHENAEVSKPLLSDKNNEYDDNYEEYDDDDDVEDEDDDDDYDDDAVTSSTSTTTTTTTTASPPPTIDPYFTHFDTLNEHVNYKSAESRLENVHRLRMSKVMRDWGDLERKYQEMRGQKGLEEEAEEFKRTVTLRFQKTIKNLEDEADAEKKQLQAVHQQRVLTHLNDKKKESMECYTSALGESPASAQKVRKCLEKLMRVLQKDRHHTLSHYRHLIKANPRQSEAEEDYTLQRLSQISGTARQALRMLSTRQPEIEKRIREGIEDYVLGLQARDDQGQLLTATNESDNVLLKRMRGEDLISQHEASLQQQQMGTVASETPAEVSAASTPITSTAGGELVKEVMTTPQSSSTSAPPTTTQQQQILNVFSNTDDDFTHEQIISVRREVFHREARPIYFTMAFAGIAVVGAIVVGLVVLNKRKRSPRSQGFLEVNMSSGGGGGSPEEKHVANMQINGYENPTYKYFETSPTTAQQQQPLVAT